MRIALKSATFSAPETALETTYFMLFLENLTKNWKKKLMIMFILIEYISFAHIFFFLLATSFVIGRNSPTMHGWREIVYEAVLFFFFPKTLQIVFVC